MKMDSLKELIVDVVNAAQGIKGSELVANEDLAEALLESALDKQAPTLLTAVNELAEEGSLVIVEYTLPPPKNNLTRAFLLPPGTNVAVPSDSGERPLKRKK